MAGEEGEEEEDGEEAGMKEGRAVAVRRGGREKNAFSLRKEHNALVFFFPCKFQSKQKMLLSLAR